MNFDMKFQPLKMQADYHHKEMNDLKIFNINSMSSGKLPSVGKALPNTTLKHRERFQSWVDLMKKGLSHMVLNNLVFFNPVSR